MQTIGERVDIVIRQTGLNKTRFAERLHLSQQFISSICSGVKQPSDRTVTDICREFGVSESWLRTGDGPMFVAQSPDEQITAKPCAATTTSKRPSSRCSCPAPMRSLPSSNAPTTTSEPS